MSTRTHKRLRFYAIEVPVIIAVGILALWGMSLDLDDHVKAHKTHCEFVAMWEEAAKHGVAPEDRPGWPNYNNAECE